MTASKRGTIYDVDIYSGKKLPDKRRSLVDSPDLSAIMVLALLYLSLAGAYLLVVPLMILFYLKLRWYTASSFERAFMYFLVFFFFPGLLVLGPFLNFRPQRRQISG